VFGLTALSSNYFKIEKKKRMKLVTDFENFGEFEKKTDFIEIIHFKPQVKMATLKI